MYPKSFRREWNSFLMLIIILKVILISVCHKIRIYNAARQDGLLYIWGHLWLLQVKFESCSCHHWIPEMRLNCLKDTVVSKDSSMEILTWLNPMSLLGFRRTVYILTEYGSFKCSLITTKLTAAWVVTQESWNTCRQLVGHLIGHRGPSFSNSPYHFHKLGEGPCET